ncbi:hypothetical protein ACHAXS_009746 [Conticribra weissflogii]
MNSYYPDRIAADDDEDDNLSICSAEIEGGVAVGTRLNGASSLVGNGHVPPPPPGTPRNNSAFNGSDRGIGTPLSASRGKGGKSPRWSSSTKSSDDEGCGDDYHEDLFHEDSDLEVSQHGKNYQSSGRSREETDPRSDVTRDASKEDSLSSNSGDQDWITQEKNRQMAFLIQNERQRRLGIRNTIAATNIAEATNHFPTTTPNNKKCVENQDATLSVHTNQNNDGGILRGIRGWFAASAGVGNASDNLVEKEGGAPSSSRQQPMQQNSLNRRSSAPVIPSHPNNIFTNDSSHGKRGGTLGVSSLKAENSLNVKTSEGNHSNSNITTSSATSNDDDGDSTSTNSDSSEFSQSSSDWSTDDENADPSDNNNGISSRYQHRTTPQERARIRALRYLSNSCVDAGRKAKTASYVRGLERLDLKRKRDRYEKELEVVESEMNKDRGVATIGGGTTAVGRRNSLTVVGRIEENEELVGESEGVDMKDIVCKMAYQLVRELPLLKGMVGKENDDNTGADAGAGKPTSKHFITFEEYAEATNAQEDAGAYADDGMEPSNLWKNKDCVDIYMAFLQKRFKEALERTRSLEKRLAVLEQTGDEIVSSLCEDLVEVTEHSNKTEARYVKKGKGLHRKRRREEIRHREKSKKVDARIQKLEERLVVVSGGGVDAVTNVMEDTDSSKSDSSLDEEDEENDEIRLERKLASIKAKDEEDKASHQSEVESIRRQCEQLKLRLSVARLVMEGDDNLREYIAVLDRLNPSLQQHRNSRRSSCCWTSYADNSYDENQLSEVLGAAAIPPPPPSRITRARAKLLKAIHLEHIYTQRMAVTKAFTDATINALEQELSEREEAGQKMEVRCLNELMAIDSEMKEILEEFRNKMTELEAEAKQLEEAIAACCAEKGIDLCFNGNEHSDVCSKGGASLKGKDDSKTDLKATDIEFDIGNNCSRTTIDTNGAQGARDNVAKDAINTSQNNSKITSITYDEENIATHEEKKEQIDSTNQFIRGGEDTGRVSIGIDDGKNKGPTPVDINANAILSSPVETSHFGDIDTTAYNQEGPLHRNELVDGSDSFDRIENEEQIPLEKERCACGEEGFLQSQLSCPPEESKHKAHQSSRPNKDDSDLKTKSSSSERFEISNSAENLGVLPSQQKAVLELLGRELTCTLADYQTGFDLSSSEERIQQLDYMNNVVIKIAKVRGLEIAPKAETAELGKFKSWSLKSKSPDDEVEDDSTEKHRSKRREKKKHKKRRRHRRREKSRKEEPVLSLKSILRQGVRNIDDSGLEAKNVFITTHDQLVW